MKIRNLVFCTLLFCPILANAVTDKPNIVLVFLDNFGWGEPGFNGGGIIRGAPTPRIDQIAAEGLRLTNFNVEVQCTPSRSALMTGRYAIRSGNGTVPLGEGVYGLVQWEVTMAEMLSAAGYATGMYGKWHLGRTEGRFPTDQGFDEWYGIPNSTDESVYSEMPGFAESGVAESYVMEGQKGSAPKKVRPYRLDYLPYTATHFPTMPHPDFVGKTGNGAWADLLAQIDSYTGELLDTLDELGIADDTIFIFTADNGPEALGYESTNMTVETAMHGSPGPWRSTLFTSYEGALRVPFAVRWPGRIAAGKSSDEIVHAMDLFPTLPRPVRKIGPRGIRRLHGQRRLRRQVAQLEAAPEGAGRLERPATDLYDAEALQPALGPARARQRAVPAYLGAQGRAGTARRTRRVAAEISADQGRHAGSIRASEIAF
jgi:arylsulfatase